MGRRPVVLNMRMSSDHDLPIAANTSTELKDTIERSATEGAASVPPSQRIVHYKFRYHTIAHNTETVTWSSHYVSSTIVAQSHE